MSYLSMTRTGLSALVPSGPMVSSSTSLTRSKTVERGEDWAGQLLVSTTTTSRDTPPVYKQITIWLRIKKTKFYLLNLILFLKLKFIYLFKGFLQQFPRTGLISNSRYIHVPKKTQYFHWLRGGGYKVYITCFKTEILQWRTVLCMKDVMDVMDLRRQRRVGSPAKWSIISSMWTCQPITDHQGTLDNTFFFYNIEENLWVSFKSHLIENYLSDSTLQNQYHVTFFLLFHLSQFDNFFFLKLQFIFCFAPLSLFDVKKSVFLKGGI